jgi:hypothetical protein
VDDHVLSGKAFPQTSGTHSFISMDLYGGNESVSDAANRTGDGTEEKRRDPSADYSWVNSVELRGFRFACLRSFGKFGQLFVTRYVHKTFPQDFTRLFARCVSRQ